jgi:hypothetical protein
MQVIIPERFTVFCTIGGMLSTRKGLTKEVTDQHAEQMLKNGVPVVIAYNTKGEQLEYTIQNDEIQCRPL